MRGVDAAGKTVHVLVAMLFRFIEAGAAGKNHVGAAQQGGLALLQLSRRHLEGGKLIHAVIDNGAGIEAGQQRQRHRRIEPHQRLFIVLQQRGEQSLQHGDLAVMEARRRDVGVRLDNGDVRRGRLLSQSRLAGLVNRLLNEQHAMVLGKTRQ